MFSFANVTPQRIVYVDRFVKTAWHCHGAPVLYCGLDGDISVEFKDAAAIHFSSAIVGPEVVHKTDLHGGRGLLMYFYPHSPEALHLSHQVLAGEDYQLAPVMPVQLKALRLKALQPKTFPDPDNSAYRQGIIDQAEAIIAGLNPQQQQHILDPRIIASIQQMEAAETLPLQDELASQVNLSRSYFNHLFSDNVGVSFRRFKQWMLLYRFSQHFKVYNNLTDAALHAGFSDSSHYTNTFKKVFGLSPTTVLRSLDHIDIQ